MSVCTIHSLTYRTDPADYFGRVHQANGAVLLDAGRPVAERGRFDIISAWPEQQLQPDADESARDFLQRLRESVAALGSAEVPDGHELPFAGGLIGYLSYDFGRRLERIENIAVDDLHLPDACFGLYAWALISDHLQQTSQLVFHPALPAGKRGDLLQLFSQADAAAAGSFSLCSAFQANLDQQAYHAAFSKIRQYIEAGDCYQVNFTQRFQASCSGDPLTAYQALRSACPTPFAAYLALPDSGAILSLSPERFLQVSQGRVETRPIKGTRARGRSASDDLHLADELLNSPKDRAENLMIVDLLRNDLGRSCATGSVQVPELFALESYPNVHHLVSSITGQLSPGKDALDLLAGSFPGGSITGAPKIRAMQIIEELEPTRRSIYCGSILYLDVRGEMDSSIAIRSLLVKDGTVSCWGGGGIVADSDWQAEYRESITKVKVLLDTLENL
ncbi:aminodeoxychorismate synthase component I [Pseudomonas sp. N040]|uniref:aminodeoxychorismate synthase component I n=1 Tax=Pseudomonas sp. N040 TaxID=2785325 RepID=UPI0018A25DC1|nr:aminodeoxychorismate synthase component I [Pseudomonas sp. N040]MBF7730785.1 aminodeoxychorismate synthase component I [Pseudomonas sp. N040]MBW7014428.1 aminodeoxychorismate synthase component I [Pseudomonas sp. N040]